MITYDDVHDLMNQLPDELPKKIAAYDHRLLREGRFLAHPAMTELFYFVIDDPNPNHTAVRAVIDLVSNLYENGDEKCKNLVLVSFIEDLASYPDELRERVRLLLKPSMQKVVDEEFSSLKR